MISDIDKQTIISCAQKFNVRSVILFGSSLDNNHVPRDIDIGIKGIDPLLFFKFYAELIKNLSLPVDVIDLSSDSLFNQLVEKNGMALIE